MGGIEKVDDRKDGKDDHVKINKEDIFNKSARFSLYIRTIRVVLTTASCIMHNYCKMYK